MESVDIWPQFIQKLAIPHKAIFLVDTVETQWNRVTEYLGENDWITTKKLSLEQVKAWAFYNAPRGSRIIESAKQYGYEAVDIAERGFEGAQSEALRKLGQTSPDVG